MAQRGTGVEDLKRHIEVWALIIATEVALFFVTLCILIARYGDI